MAIFSNSKYIKRKTFNQKSFLEIDTIEEARKSMSKILTAKYSSVEYILIVPWRKQFTGEHNIDKYQGIF